MHFVHVRMQGWAPALSRDPEWQKVHIENGLLEGLMDVYFILNHAPSIKLTTGGVQR